MSRVKALERQKMATERESGRTTKRIQTNDTDLQVEEEEDDDDNEDDDDDSNDWDELRNSSAAYCWGSGLPPPQDPTEGVPKYVDRFLPHHYFDYFFGTSTGG